MKWIISVSLLSLLQVVPVEQVSADECKKWFDRGKIKPGKDCELRCAMLSSDMATFDCSNRCPEFCNSTIKETFIFKISDLYPGLTAQERALASKYPKDVLHAYRLSWKAEEACLTRFPRMESNDESDACRHFVWAGLMAKELNVDLAQQILDAHEQEPTQPPEEKAMDLANNQRGVSFLKDDEKAKNVSEKTLLQEFDRLLKVGKIVVLKPRYSKGGMP